MAHQTTSIPTSNPRNQPISWPNPEENMPRVLPASEDRIFRSSLSAAERSLKSLELCVLACDRYGVNLRSEQPSHFGTPLPVYHPGACE